MSDHKPVLIELDEAPLQGPDTAPPVPDALPQGAAMQTALRLGARRLPLWARLGWAALLGFVGLIASVAAWDFVTDLAARNPALGWLGLGLVVAVGLSALVLAIRELAALRRLRRLDDLRAQAESAFVASDRRAAQGAADALRALYAARSDMAWGRDRLAQILPDQPDAAGVLSVTEATLMAPLDQLARAEIESAARQVALLTAMIPMALVDMAAAMAVNLRLIRRIAQIYGGRAGTFGSLRLLRAVMAHLLATGLLAVGDDVLGSVAGGGVLGKLSRRFGEGVVNGALTARLGIAAMELCRPLPFRTLPRPRATNLISRALVGLFDRTGG